MVDCDDSITMYLAELYEHCYAFAGVKMQSGPLAAALRSIGRAWAERGCLPNSLPITGEQTRRLLKGELERISATKRLRTDILFLIATLQEKGARFIPPDPWTIIDVGAGVIDLRNVWKDYINVSTFIPVDPRLGGPHPGSIEALGRGAVQGGNRILIAARYSLHHMKRREQDAVVSFAAGANAVFLIVEDLLADADLISECRKCETLTARWNGFTLNQRKQALELNDLWANGIAYDRGLIDHVGAHQDPSIWRDMVCRQDLQVLSEMRVGVDHHRNHGVPTYRAVASLSAETRE